MKRKELTNAEERAVKGLHMLAIDAYEEDPALAHKLAATGRSISEALCTSDTIASYTAGYWQGRKEIAAGRERIHGQLCDDKQGGKRGKSLGYSHLSWACPYFSYDAKRVIKCEAGRITFPDRQAEREHTHNFCADIDGWKRCTLAALMSDYYERINDAEFERRKKELGL